MCDYSLETYSSRPAREFERYVTRRFASGSIGLTTPGHGDIAVCIRYGSRLTLEDIPLAAGRLADAAAIEDAVFVRLENGAYRDGVRFANGRHLSLQQLSIGVSVTVIPGVEAILDRARTLEMA